MKPDLRSLTLVELQSESAALSWPRYAADQVFTWLWQKGVDDFGAMTNLSKERRALLAERYTIGRLELLRTQNDDDGTTKFTFKLADGNIIESVLIPSGGDITRSSSTGIVSQAGSDRTTVCVSTQVGCRLGCGFCYTATLGFKRDLAWHEIASQVLSVRSFVPRPSSFASSSPSPSPLAPSPISNVVFMGMGEPFLNYDATIEAAKTINAENGLGIGARRITISTAGIPDGIRAFIQVEQQFRLALSLNASDDETRSRLMPVNKLHPLKEVMAAVREYTAAKGKRVTFEYVLVDGVNNRDKDVHQLAALLKGIPCKVNLIPLNPYPGCELKAPSDQSVHAFAKKLWPLVPAVTVRRSKGARILAGCGQLAGLSE
ncbi:23S rRNA (adenine(2503)-C(2))-methyltransferase RlmN [candidate division WOR-3 bacterium]|nr:23S rRNA (adenine(2503)-C(2))-methyltransferase RlmN [candidate division WOR-3 bacterium]